MKILFLFVFVSLIMWAVAQDGSTTPADTNKTTVVLDDNPAHVDESIKANPEIASSITMPTSPMGGLLKSKCECGAFNTTAPTEQDKSILSMVPLNVTCDANGDKDCNILCYVLAEAAKERAPQMLCSVLGHYNDLKTSVHSRICGANAWTYTGLTSSDAICCHQHKVIDCKDQDTITSAN